MRGSPLPKRIDMEAEAEAFRQRYAPNHIGALDIERIVEFELRIGIIPTPRLCRTLKVKAWAACDQRAIVVDRNIFKDQPEEYRQLLAHEVAHILRHCRLFPTQAFASHDDCRRFHAEAAGTTTALVEHEAQLWAGYVLIPRRELEMVFKRVVADVKADFEETWGIFDLEESDELWLRQVASVDVVRSVAAHFGVTESWADRRIRDDGLWKRLTQEFAMAPGRARVARTE